MTVILYFNNHAPIRVSAPREECEVEIANAKLMHGFVSWEEVKPEGA